MQEEIREQKEYLEAIKQYGDDTEAIINFSYHFISNALQAQREDIVDMLYAHKLVHDGYTRTNNEIIESIINLINNK